MPEVGGDEVGGAHGVDDAVAGGVAAGEGEVALADAFVEVEGFAFDAVVFGRAAVLAFGAALEAEGDVDVEKEGHVGDGRADGEGVELLDGLDGEAAAEALVGGGGPRQAGCVVTTYP